jgi:cytochrome P450
VDVEMLDGRAVCPVDHHSAEFAQHHREILDDLRESAPLVWSPLYGGFWIATRFDIVRRLAMDSAGLTVAPGPHRTGGIQIPAPPGLKTRPLFVPGEADGQEHDDYRMALNPHFSKQRVAELTPMIERHVSGTIDAILDSRRFDVVNDLVGPILAGVACEHLGLEVENPAGFFQAMFEMVSYTPTESSGGDKFDQVARAFSQEWQAVVDLVADRRSNPREDVVSHLVRWTTPAFTDEQIQMMTLNVILGASDTTKSLVSQAVLYLDQDREVRDRLRRQPDLIRKSVEEFLRLFVVAMGPCRTATQDVEIAGVTIKQGERLMLSFPAANHDPAKYPDPDEFSLERGAGQHLAMGVGTHFCLGAWLAKSISTITLRELLDRVPDYVVDADGIRGAHDKNSLNHFESMPAAVTPDDLLASAP